MTPRIFVMMNVFEEHAWIKGALRQLDHPALQDIVVVDSSGDLGSPTLDLARYTVERMPRRPRLYADVCTEQPFCRRRNYAFLKCKELGATHVLIVDPDERYKTGALNALLERVSWAPGAAIYSVKYTEYLEPGKIDVSQVRVDATDNGWSAVPRVVNLYAHEPIECTDGGLGYYSFAAHELPKEWMQAGKDAGKEMRHELPEAWVVHYGTALGVLKNKGARDIDLVMSRLEHPEDRDGIGFAALQVSTMAWSSCRLADDLMQKVMDAATDGNPMPLPVVAKVATAVIQIEAVRGRFRRAREKLTKFRAFMGDNLDLLYLEGIIRMEEAIHATLDGRPKDIIDQAWMDAEEITTRAVDQSKTETNLGRVMTVHYGAKPIRREDVVTR